MPNAVLRISDKTHSERVLNLCDAIPIEIARRMSCKVPIAGDADVAVTVYHEIEADDEVDFWLEAFSRDAADFPRLPILYGPALATLEVDAYPYADRINNIDQRMDFIALRVKTILGHQGDDTAKVSWTFGRVELGLWGSV